MNKKERENFYIFAFLVVYLYYFWICFLVRAVNATVHNVTTAIAAAIEMSAVLLNSGTAGVEDAPVGAEVGLGVEVPLVGSDITARVP